MERRTQGSGSSGSGSWCRRLQIRLRGGSGNKINLRLRMEVDTVKYYHMIIEPKAGGKRKEYIHHRQGAAPAGWKCVGVCGYHEAPKKDRDTKSEAEGLSYDEV